MSNKVDDRESAVQKDQRQADEEEGGGFDNIRRTNPVTTIENLADDGAPPVEPECVVKPPSRRATLQSQPTQAQASKLKKPTRTGLAGNTGPGAFAASPSPPMLEEHGNSNNDERGIATFPSSKKKHVKSITTMDKSSAGTESELIPGVHEMVAVHGTKQQLGKPKGLRGSSKQKERRYLASHALGRANDDQVALAPEEGNDTVSEGDPRREDARSPHRSLSIISQTSTGDLIQAVLVEEPQEVPSSNQPTMEVFNAVQVDPKENDPEGKPIYAHKHFKYWAGGILLVLILTVIIAVSVTARSGSTAQFMGVTNAPSATPSMAPVTAGPTTLAPTAESSNYEPIHQLVGHFVEDPSQLSNASSPYYDALRWLVYSDEIDPNSVDFDYEKMQQRYILALFYHSTKAKNDPNSWLACNPPTGNETTECIHKAYDSSKNGAKYVDMPATRWLTSLDECDWAGLHCDGWGKVFKIALRHYNLAGTLPNELGLLSGLTQLDVETDEDGYFRLHGTLPTFVAMLPRPEKLILSGNQYPGTIPDELCDATSLVTLEVAKANLRGTIPTCFGQLTNLWRLELDDNRLTGTIPTELNLLMRLHEVELHKNSITGTVPSGGILCNLEREIRVDCDEDKGDPPDIICPEGCFCDC